MVDCTVDPSTGTDSRESLTAAVAVCESRSRDRRQCVRVATAAVGDRRQCVCDRRDRVDTHQILPSKLAVNWRERDRSHSLFVNRGASCAGEPLEEQSVEKMKEVTEGLE